MMRSLTSWLLALAVGVSPLTIHAQGNSVKRELPKGWHLMDKDQDGYYGISLNKANQPPLHDKSQTDLDQAD